MACGCCIELRQTASTRSAKALDPSVLIWAWPSVLIWALAPSVLIWAWASTRSVRMLAKACSTVSNLIAC